MRMHSAGVSLMDQARVQNIKYFSEWDKQKQKQPILLAAVDQLASTTAGHQPQQQTPPPTGPQPQETAPPPLPDASAETDRRDTDRQEKDADQSDMQMGDRSGVHASGSTGPTGDAKET